MVRESIVLREYLPIWQGHLSHWVASAGDIPIYVFRYEDMLLRAEEVLRFDLVAVSATLLVLVAFIPSLTMFFL